MRIKFVTLVALFSALLAGCGGGSDSNTSAACRPTMANPDLCLSSAEIASRVVLAVYPPSITVGDCTTNIPFVFTGGVAPFTIYSSDNFRAPVSSAQPLGPNSYFMASIDLTRSGQPVPATGQPYSFIVTVLDSESKTATAKINVPTAATITSTAIAVCPTNPLLQIVSASQNAHVTEKLAMQITGGSGAGTYGSMPSDYVFTDESTSFIPKTVSSIAAVTDIFPTSINVQALAVGTTLLTVTSTDGQKASVRLTVLSPP